ncbi:serine/threonine-protein phosphatase 7 long form-like protein [Trifolium medium]|uniref:Serine/threonine-protein phosphatase 7 long form-like protein n=1 Tax=Trifolium medium TaxID=97028 RepID=A0A392QFB7_9FABA|nr:serine/threonine-protein phosphatase 7 long form-like protein [Trifolium medium]
MRSGVIKPAIRTWGLANTGFSFLDRSPLATFVDRWHGETNNFHISGGEITTTLDDVYCLLHIPIDGRLLEYHNIICKVDGIELMVTYLGASLAAADSEVTQTRRLMSGLHT